MLEIRNGYSQMKLNYIKDYSRAIYEKVIRMDVAWNSSDLIDDENIMTENMELRRAEIESLINSLQSYLEPFEEMEDE